MALEFNEKFVEQSTKMKTDDGGTIEFSPVVYDEYYLFRVHLYKDQYLLAFPKFGTLGIGFALEDDWNTNLPYICDTDKIYDHIKCNKKYKEIKKRDVINAINELKAACFVYDSLRSGVMNELLHNGVRGCK